MQGVNDIKPSTFHLIGGIIAIIAAAAVNEYAFVFLLAGCFLLWAGYMFRVIGQ